MNTHKNQRKVKRRVNRVTKKLRTYGFFEDCNYHPCVVVSVGKFYQDLYGSDVEGVSLITGNGTACSIMHCGPLVLKKTVAIERAKIWREQDKIAYYRHLGANNEAIAEMQRLQDLWEWKDPIISTKSIQQIINEHFIEV